MKRESKDQPPAPPPVFRRHMITSMRTAGMIIGGSLVVGVAGYHFLGGLDWLDALVNASMILGGMGPVDPIKSSAGKWFESGYALYSGVALLTTVGVLFAPALHRVLHKFHIDEKDQERSAKH
jgi:hypothetical protein